MRARTPLARASVSYSIRRSVLSRSGMSRRDSSRSARAPATASSGRTRCPRDADDERVLAEALAEASGQSTATILTGLAPQIADRVTQIEHGARAAAELGREHGQTGTPPYCDLEIDGDATTLLHALGETEWMTDANHSGGVRYLNCLNGCWFTGQLAGWAAGVSLTRMR